MWETCNPVTLWHLLLHSKVMALLSTWCLDVLGVSEAWCKLMQGGPVPCHVMASRAMPGHIFACHAIFLRVMPCHDDSVSCRVRFFSGKMVPGFFANCPKYMPVLCQEYMLFFSLPSSNQPRLNTQQQGRAPPGVAPSLPPARAPVVVC